MYSIEEKPYGFILYVEGKMNVDEAEELKSALINRLAAYKKEFSLIVDIRRFIPVGSEVLEKIQEMQEICKLMSLIRAAVITTSPVVKRQITQSTHKTEVSNISRMIDASKADDWEEQALEWIEKAIEPTAVIIP